MLTGSLLYKHFQLATEMRLNLTVKLTDISRLDFTRAVSPKETQPLPTCDRCHDFEEIVVAIMQILPLEETWALCGLCVREMPNGYHLA
jgi:hypothetical protein